MKQSLFLIVVGIAIIGCGSSQPTPPSASAPGTPPPDVTKPANHMPPEAVAAARGGATNR